MMSNGVPALSEQVAAWLAEAMGAPMATILFQRSHLSLVTAGKLTDGRRVVVKARPPAARLHACHAVHLHLAQRGFPCPRPLVGPTEVGGEMLTVEELDTRDAQGSDLGGPQTVTSALLLARLVRTAPPIADLPGSLEPPPPWIDWDSPVGRWPLPDDLDLDLDRLPETHLDAAADRVRRRIAAHDGTPVVGHCDWERHNVRWTAAGPIVHDWDSVAAAPEVVLVGAAAAVHAGGSAPGAVAADVAGTERFLDVYEVACGTRWSRRDREVAWAAGLWVLLFNAKKETAGGFVGTLAQLERELDERLRRAGA